jgi:hypothetical protein
MSGEYERGAALLDTLSNLNSQDIRLEVKRLRAIEQWAIKSLNLDYTVGDAVKVIDYIPCMGGWDGYQECLAIGTTGTVLSIDFSEYHQSWHALYAPDRIWTARKHWRTGEVQRLWRWPGTDAPEGMEPYPGGPKRSTFMLRTSDLARTTNPRDTPTDDAQGGRA